MSSSRLGISHAADCYPTSTNDGNAVLCSLRLCRVCLCHGRALRPMKIQEDESGGGLHRHGSVAQLTGQHAQHPACSAARVHGLLVPLVSGIAPLSPIPHGVLRLRARKRTGGLRKVLQEGANAQHVTCAEIVRATS